MVGGLWQKFLSKIFPNSQNYILRCDADFWGLLINQQFSATETTNVVFKKRDHQSDVDLSDVSEGFMVKITIYNLLREKTRSFFSNFLTLNDKWHHNIVANCIDFCMMYDLRPLIKNEHFNILKFLSIIDIHVIIQLSQKIPNPFLIVVWPHVSYSFWWV